MYREHYGLVWGAARRFGVDDNLLDDAVQEAFLVAYRRMGSFDGRSPKAWLYGITRRVASNVRRSERRTTRRKDAVKHSMQTATSRSAEAVEAWQALDRFLEGLSERQREIFVLSELEGMTGAEVARSLSLRPSTTYDAIRALRRRFTEQIADPPPPDT
ncbi:MAG: sigma-70 family RNA polymerase sigma factor, partial [Nannocystaceae bacterium]